MDRYAALSISAWSCRLEFGEKWQNVVLRIGRDTIDQPQGCAGDPRKCKMLDQQEKHDSRLNQKGDRRQYAERKI
jgi:hypothetical protein